MKKLLNKSLTRIGRKYFTKRSDFFERFEKLKQERELTKEKFINKNEFLLNEVDEEEGEEIRKYKEELKEQLFSETEYVNTYEKSQNDQNKKKVDQFFENEKTLKEKISEYLGKSQNSKTEFLKKSEKLINSKKDFPTFLKNINEESDHLEDYDRYDYYKKNYIEQESNLKMKKRDENKFMRRNEKDFLSKGLNNFYKNLDEKIEKNKPLKVANSVEAKILYQIKKEKFKESEKKKQNDPQNQEKSSNNESDQESDDDEFIEEDHPEDYDPNDDEDINFEFVSRLKSEAAKQKNPETLASEKNFENDYLSQLDINSKQQEIIDDKTEKFEEREKNQFSLRAEFQIYLFYLEGWKIRDLTLRFGATPQTIKSTIWNLQYFFEDILPNLTIAEACYLLSMEENKTHPNYRVDYGVDLADLRDKEVGFISMLYPRKTLDHIPRNKNEHLIDKNVIDDIVEKIKGKRDDLINENFVTKGVEPYLIRNWVVHRGKGAIKVNRTFREIVQRSHYKGYQKKNVEKRLDKGPRIAAQGYGYK